MGCEGERSDEAQQAASEALGPREEEVGPHEAGTGDTSQRIGVVAGQISS